MSKKQPEKALKSKREKISSANDSSFPVVLESAIHDALKTSRKGALFHVSIDNFSMLISSHGGEFADDVLGELISDVRDALPNLDKGLISQVGRDQFSLVLLDEMADDVKKTAKTLHNLIQNYGCTRSIVPMHIISTIGVVDFPDNAESVKDVINRAYVALSDAKQGFRHFAIYGNSRKHEIESKNQLILASYIQNALLNNRLCMAYQPIVERKSGEVAWYECLLRIADAKGTLSSAGPFIPIAEKMGFIDLIDSFVLRTVVDELKRNPDVKFGLNLSNSTIQDSDWLTMAVRMIADAGVADRLILEITETVEQRDVKKVVRFVATMQDLGCKIALDDFGAGFTSLSQLKHLPVDVIKIDGSYVRDIVYNPESRMFVKTLLDFSKNFGLQTIAEFVENAEIANLLTEMGVDYMQGNYFSPAVTTRSWMDDKRPD